MRLRRRRPGHEGLEVAPGETALASAVTADGKPVCGTRDALYLPVRIPWERIETADWDSGTSTLRVVETDAEPFALVLEDDEPRRLLQLIRERVTASVVLQRHVPVSGSRGLRVIARRAPGRRDELPRRQRRSPPARRSPACATPASAPSGRR